MGNAFCEPDSPDYPKWTSWDVVKWKFEALKGRGNAYLFKYKDGWVIHNSQRIKDAASKNSIPPLLLAGVAWAEVGGAPDLVDDAAFAARSFDYSGPDWIDRNLTITSPPGKTSVGAVSIQLRVAARELGLNFNSMTYEKQVLLKECLESDKFNIDVVAIHLHGLILYDYPKADTSNLSDEQLIVAGSRYNRGTGRKLKEIVDSISAPRGTPSREYSSYGRRLLEHRDRVMKLLNQ